MTLLILAFASYRFTRFVTRDTLWVIWRERLLDNLLAPKGSETVDGYRDDIPRPAAIVLGKLGELIECYWCAGFWVSLLVYCLFFTVLPWNIGIFGLIAWWAIAGLQGFIGALEPGDDAA